MQTENFYIYMDEIKIELMMFSLADHIGSAIDVAGEVMEVGSGVKNFKAGNKVVAVLSARVSPNSVNFQRLLVCVLQQCKGKNKNIL